MKKLNVDSIDDDCWGLIFQRLRDHNYDLASVSLACKRFLLITDRAKVSLRVSNLTLHLLPRLLRRFQNLKSIEFLLQGPIEPDRAVTPVFQSDLQHLESLIYHPFFPELFLNTQRKSFHELGIKIKGLKRLDLSGLSNLCDDNLTELKDFFPCLEDLTIGGRNNGDLLITDDGIEALSLKLNRLKKISLSNCTKITGKSIMFLSSNCVDLMDVTIGDCELVTENGVGFLMRHSPQLNSLSLFDSSHEFFWEWESEFTFKNSISYAKNLEHLNVSGLCVSNEVLYAIAKASPPLKSFYYINEGEDIDGLVMVLRSCPSLKEFITHAHNLTDSSVLEIPKYLGGLTHIELHEIQGLGSAAFFALTKNCPSLESIIMGGSSFGDGEDIYDDVHPNYQMKHLDLSYCSLMKDETLIRFVSVCPNLEFLTLSHCDRDITNEGVAVILRLCPKLTHLNVSRLEVSKFVGQSDDGKLKLTSVIANKTSINDEALEVMGKRCPDLQELIIRGCENVTNYGVKVLMSKCVKLRKINVVDCMNVRVDKLASDMDWRPLLKQKVPSSPYEETGLQRNVFLHNGGMVLVDTTNDNETLIKVNSSCSST